MALRQFLSLFLVLAATTAAQAGEESLGEVMRKYDCDVAFPNEAFSVDALNRPGHMFAKIRALNVRPFKFYFMQKDEAGVAIKHWVSPSTALPPKNTSVETKDFQLKTTASVSLKAEIKNIFEALNLSWDYLDDVSIDLEEVSLYHPNSDLIADMVAEGAGRTFVKSKIMGPGTSRVVTATCVAKITYTFHWKNSLNLSIVNLEIAKLNATFGFNANWTVEKGADGKSVKYTSGVPVTIGVVLDKTSEYRM